MEDTKTQISDSGDVEDVPSDFFDDFSNDDFIEGLSVIDSWNKTKNASPENLVNKRREDRDREVSSEPKDVQSNLRSSRLKEPSPNVKYSSSQINDIIKPGSRRDPDKTNKAIIKDKEEKVKKYLAKHLESSDNLRPPGTELDDYLNENVPVKPFQKDKVKLIEKKLKKAKKRISRDQSHESPVKKHLSRKPHNNHEKSSSRYSPQRNYRRHSPHWRSPVRRSPNRWRHSTNHHAGYRSRSPVRLSFRRHSPSYYSSRYIPSQSAPWRSPRKSRRSKSPHRQELHHYHSRSPTRKNDFVYSMQTATYSQANELHPSYYSSHTNLQYVQGSQGSNYPGVNVMPSMVPAVDMQLNTISGYSQPVSNINPIPVPSELMVPVSQNASSQVIYSSNNTMNMDPYDDLAKLYAEGKISKEDYLKLAPKGIASPIDSQQRISVLNRCDVMVNNLSKLLLPKSLIVDFNTFNSDTKSIFPKYCSPLKRQAEVQFQFTKQNNESTMARRNKRLVDSIIATLDLRTVVPRTKKSKINTKDIGVQTMKPFCELCSIRESTTMIDESTCIDYEHINTHVHTQVVEQDLKRSRAVFNPSGGVSDGAHISIAHMTPAQLVSQLAARAKSLQQTEGPSYSQSRQYGGNTNYGNREEHQEYQKYYRY